MNTLEKIIFFIQLVWFTASVIYVTFNRRMGIYTARWDVFRWLSAYQLFAETERHFRLSYRDESEGMKKSEWRIIPLFVRQKWYHPILFPEGLTYKLINSFVDDLVRFWEAKQNTAAAKTISERFIYRVVLQFVWRCPVEEGTFARQFKIEEMEQFGSNENIREIFISEIHRR